MHKSEADILNRCSGVLKTPLISRRDHQCARKMMRNLVSFKVVEQCGSFYATTQPEKCAHLHTVTDQEIVHKLDTNTKWS